MPAERAHPDPQISRYPLGVAMVLGAGVCLSTAGILLRQVETASGWQILFYRGGVFAVMVLLVAISIHRRNFLHAMLQTGWEGVVVAVALGLGSICYVFAILHTTVANALFILSSAPFFTAIAGWILLGETVRRSTWLAMMTALLGIGLMVADGIRSDSVLGIVFAFGVVVSYVTMIVTLRRVPNRDMLPALWLAGVVTVLVAAPMTGSLALSRHDLGIALLLGTVQYGAGFMLIVMGSRHVPGAEVALLSLSETVLAPIWVWLGVGEQPSNMTLAGGAIVLCALVARAIVGIRSERRAILYSPPDMAQNPRLDQRGPRSARKS